MKRIGNKIVDGGVIVSPCEVLEYDEDGDATCNGCYFSGKACRFGCPSDEEIWVEDLEFPNEY